jgi:hypothetical protein
LGQQDGEARHHWKPGLGRGVLFTEKQYRRYRSVFDVRHVSGNPDHQACVLFFVLMAHFDSDAPDVLKAIQFQVPLAGPGTIAMAIIPTAKAPRTETNSRPLRARSFDPREWSRVEILVDADAGTARMAIGQPVGGKAVEAGRMELSGQQRPWLPKLGA